MVNEFGIRKYIRMLLEQRPTKVGFGNAQNQNQFSIATKPIRSRLSNYIAYGDFQYSINMKSNNDQIRNVITKTILDQQKNIQASNGKYKYFQNHRFTKDEIRDLFLDNEKQKWLGQYSKEITGREFLNKVYRYYRFFDLLDVDNDGIPADIDDVSLSLANYFTINEEEIKNNIKKNVYGKYVKSENTQMLANFTSYGLATDAQKDAYIEKSQRYMKTMLRPYIDVFEKSMIEFLYEELYYGAINATENEMEYNTTILLPYPNLYYSLDYMKKQGASFVESEVSYDTYAGFFATLHDQIQNMKDVFDPKTTKTTHQLQQIFSDPQKYNIIIYSLDLKWSPNLVHEETEERQHPDITQADLGKNPTAFYDWEISKSHSERISPKALHLSDLNSFLLAVKNTAAGTAITKSLDKSLVRIDKQSKAMQDKIQKNPKLQTLAVDAREPMGSIQPEDVEEAIEEIIDIYKDRTGIDITKFLTYDAEKDQYVNAKRSDEMREYELDLYRTLVKFNKLSKDLLETYAICRHNARTLKEKQSFLSGESADIQLSNIKNVIQILDGKTEDRQIMRWNLSQLVDPDNKILRDDKYYGYFPIILKLGYNRPSKLSSAAEVAAGTLEFVEVEFKNAQQRIPGSNQEKNVRVATQLPTFYTTRGQRRNAEKLHSINRQLLQQIDQLPDFDIVNHSKISSLYSSTDPKYKQQKSTSKRFSYYNTELMKPKAFVKKLEKYEKKLKNIYDEYAKVAGKLYLVSRRFTNSLNSPNTMGAVIRVLELYKDYNEKNISAARFVNDFKEYKIGQSIREVLKFLSFKDYPSFNKHFKIDTDNETVEVLKTHSWYQYLVPAIEKEDPRKKFKRGMAKYQTNKHKKFKKDLQDRIKESQKKFDSISDFTKHSQETLDMMAEMYSEFYKDQYKKYFTDNRFTTDEVRENLAKLKSGSESDFDNMPFHMLQGVLKAYQQMLQYQAFETEYAKSGEVMTKGQQVELDLIGQLDDTDKYLAAMKRAALNDDTDLFSQGIQRLQKELQKVINQIDDPAKSIEASGQKNTLIAARWGLEYAEVTVQLFDEIEEVMEMKEKVLSSKEEKPEKQAKTFLEYLHGTIDNHENVDDDWRGEEIDYFADLNMVFDEPVDPGKIYIGVTRHPGNSTDLMKSLKSRFGSSFERSRATDHDIDGSLSWNNSAITEEADLVYIHISIKKDAFSSATNFDQAMKLAALLFGLCDELDGSVTYHSPHRHILNNLFGKITPYGAGSKVLGYSEPLKSAINPINYNYEPEYFVDLLDVEWVFSSPLQSDIELNFIVPKK